MAIQAIKKIPPINWIGVPPQFVRKVSAVCWNLRDCEELVKWFGDATFAPFLPIAINAPGGWALVAGMGYADAAELQDCAIHLWHTRSEKIDKTGSVMDFDTLREKHHYASRDRAGQAIAEAMMERVKKHKANPRTDPFRQMKYPNPTQRVQFLVDGTRDGFSKSDDNRGNSGELGPENGPDSR